MEKPTPEVVRIGRLEKKIRKLKQQMAATKEQNAHLNEVLKYYPYASGTHEERKQREKDREELKELRVRVEEQSALIKRLTKENESLKEKYEKEGDPNVLAIAEAMSNNKLMFRDLRHKIIEENTKPKENV
jgi:predicted RNase H-like nuclease (RuvC/YqgF family)